MDNLAMWLLPVVTLLVILIALFVMGSDDKGKKEKK